MFAGGSLMSRIIYQLVVLGLGVMLLGACGLVAPKAGVVPSGAVSQEEGMSVNPKPVMVDKRAFRLAGEISSETWVNSEGLDWKALRGKVVVVDFWTFACYNCKNTLPYKKSWDAKYRDRGLVVLGVHTPELSFERDVENVRKAVKEYNIEYPVAIDGDFANWNRYDVYAWPTWFIVDKEGYIRYTHVGEGDYAGSERVIQQLLAE
jgi:thiol-disulfide isomerase/thioredoxin